MALTTRLTHTPANSYIFFKFIEKNKGLKLNDCFENSLSLFYPNQKKCSKNLKSFIVLQKYSISQKYIQNEPHSVKYKELPHLTYWLGKLPNPLIKYLKKYSNQAGLGIVTVIKI